MTVKELIARLEDMNPDAEVRLMLQPSWPFEHTIAGVVERSEFGGADGQAGCRDDDVLILEGGQRRYGSKQAWEV